MLTAQWLDETFKVYFEEMDRCRKAKCYWALLHLVLVLPDVCAAMETDNGETKGELYKQWCAKYLSDHLIQSNDWYQMRCRVLHQGITQDTNQRSQYTNVAFSQPSEHGMRVHRCVNETPEGKVLQLDVGEMEKEMRAALSNRWFVQLLKQEQPQIVLNVTRNANRIVRLQDKPAMPIVVKMHTTQTLTTSRPQPWT